MLEHLTTRLGKKPVVDGGDGGCEVGKPSEGKGLGDKGLEGTRDSVGSCRGENGGRRREGARDRLTILRRFRKAEVRRFQAVASNLCEFRKWKWKRKIKMKKEEEGKKRDRRAEKRPRTTTAPLWRWVQDLDTEDDMSSMAEMVAAK
ncbi:hypothetical protein DVH24_037109 [Malus domestica]|uniref:Uncharacterized protein n=1 Tax=Malus domestica TaxID=3750 RepID=A0A498HIJ7_MALDO|nr:hypothetical protein DVH24_037109 [Malus domestica]